jgi:N-acyl-D-aspartate/D-glutamate deacylase
LFLPGGRRPDLTHATLNFPNNKGRAPELLALIDRARGGGSDITLDTYPYLPGCTTLAALLPSWASAGGPAETLKKLHDGPTREKIRVALEVEGCDGGHGVPVDWSRIQVSPRSLSRCEISSYSFRVVGSAS